MGSTFQEIEINAPANTVWRAISNFHELGWAPNVVTGVEVVGDRPGTEPGAGRVLNGVFHETLQTLDSDAMTFTYSIDQGPPPLLDGDYNNYIGKVVVEDKGDSTRVEWTSSWEQNDESIYDFCHPIYVALLKDMKASLEA
jgi:hypothetical protein